MKRLHRRAHNEVCRALDVGVDFRTTLLFENSLRDGPVWVAFFAHRNMNGRVLHTAAYVMPVSIRCAKLGNNSYTGPGAAGRRAMWRHRSKELKRELRYLNWRCQTSESWAGHSPRYPLHPLKASAFPHFFARLSFPEIGGRKEVAAISRLAQT